jgi:hypothetical protein
LGASFVVSVVVVVVLELGAVGVAGVVVLDVVDELDVLVSGAFASVAGAGAGAGAGVGATTTAGGDAGGGVTVFSWQAASAITADAMTRSGLFMLIPSLGGSEWVGNGRPKATLVESVVARCQPNTEF